MAPLARLLRPLRGANLEVFKFGMYLLFPISWMYYFGTNLENRFTVENFWPTQEQSHKIPFEREEIKAELERIQQNLRLTRRRQELESGGGVETREPEPDQDRSSLQARGIEAFQRQRQVREPQDGE